MVRALPRVGGDSGKKKIRGKKLFKKPPREPESPRLSFEPHPNPQMPRALALIDHFHRHHVVPYSLEWIYA